MIDSSLQRTLTNVGFDDKEAGVYLALLELGSAPISGIAKEAGFKRSIVYHVVERLLQKGYVHEIQGRKVRRFMATEPTKILHSTMSVVEDFRTMIPIFRSLQGKGRTFPRIEFFDTKESIINVYRTFDKGKEMRFVTSIKRLKTFMEEEVEAWVRRFQSGAFPAGGNHLLSDTKDDRYWAAQASAHGQQVKILPDKMEMEMDFAIVDDVLAITSFDPLFAVVIRSSDIAKSAGKLFDLAGTQGNPL